ncbi:galaxin-like [Micropterus salmoides]|uniref:galaxin-like n=1 Tax=Micropterus salmoides TaxID=27706 RepID=UPI0018EAECA8|nr:galaxin-like [Micropterus salmoides]
MVLLWALVLAWLACGFTTVCESDVGGNATSKNDCYRKICMDMHYDICEAVYCENHLRLGAGRSCCGKQAFNPAVATCCKVTHGYNITAHVTEGLSEQVSSCCGLKAYNSLNEICCQSTIVVKPAPKAQCCGKEAFDEEKQLCCGPKKKILTRNSSDHECCGYDQYNTKTQWCCVGDRILEIHPINSSSCKEAFDEEKQLCCGPKKKILTRNSSDHECCGYDQYNTKTQWCCVGDRILEIHPINSSSCKGELLWPYTLGFDKEKHLCCGPNMTILTRNSSDHECCGYDQYNMKTQWCCVGDRILEIHPINSSSCKEVFDKEKHLCCGPNMTILTRNSSDHECCGYDQYNMKTQWCCVGDRILEIHPINSSSCKEAFDEEKQLCCGPKKKILTRNSSDHECCGYDQ